MDQLSFILQRHQAFVLGITLTHIIVACFEFIRKYHFKRHDKCDRDRQRDITDFNISEPLCSFFHMFGLSQIGIFGSFRFLVFNWVRSLLGPNTKENRITDVNFVTILIAAFTHADPKSTKKTDGISVFFCVFVTLRT